MLWDVCNEISCSFHTFSLLTIKSKIFLNKLQQEALFHLPSLTSLCVQVRDEMKGELPSEVQAPTEEVQNPCRLDLRPPDRRGLPSDQNPSSRAQHRPRALLILAIVLLMSSLLMIDWKFRHSVQLLLFWRAYRDCRSSVWIILVLQRSI